MSEDIQDTRPLYAQIKVAIEQRIEEELWPADFQIPSEAELAEEFGASPLTVRRALRELQSDGVVVRIQGRGTFVTGPRMQCAVFELRDVSEEIDEQGGAHVSEVLLLQELGPWGPFSGMLTLGPGGRVFHARLLHNEDGTPIQIEDRFVNASEAPDFLRQDFSRITPHAYLLRNTKINSVDNSIRAIRPDEESQALLRVGQDQPCLLLDRQTWRGEVPVTRSRFLYPGDRYRLHSSHEATPTRLASMTAAGGRPSPRRIR